MQQIGSLQAKCLGGLVGARLSVHGPWFLAQLSTLRLCWHFSVSLYFAGCGWCCQSSEYWSSGAGLVVSGFMVWVVAAWSMVRGSRTLGLSLFVSRHPYSPVHLLHRGAARSPTTLTLSMLHARTRPLLACRNHPCSPNLGRCQSASPD